MGQRHSVGLDKAGLGRRAAVAGIDLGAVAGHRGDHAGAGIDSAYAAIESIGKVGGCPIDRPRFHRVR